MKSLARKHILKLSPYSSARDEFEGNAEVYLDANENPHDFEFSRYPDPHQRKLKQRISQIKGIPTERIFLGNGSDEIIDLLIRSFCEPTEDAILTCQPGFSMYAFSAELNQTRNDEYLLSSTFDIELDSFLNTIQENHKLIFICSPNNPTGNSIPINTIQKICDAAKGLVIVDEAYVDFSNTGSCLPEITNDNLVVLQTFSKSLGSAGIRLGMGFMHPEIVKILAAVKLPYNISEIAQQHAFDVLENYKKIESSIQSIKQEREFLKDELIKSKHIITVHPSDANFFLVEFTDAKKMYTYLMENGVIVRDRSNVVLCDNCLRITVGLAEENKRLITLISQF